MKTFKKLAVMMFAVLCMAALPFLEAKAEGEMMIVYAQVPADWENPCVWAWADDGTNAFDAWPGGSMTADENNEGWYYAYVPVATGGNVIVNANEGGVQTADHKTNGADVWLIIADAETVEVTNEQQTQGDLPAYVEPAPEEEQEPAAEPVTEEMITVHAKAPADWLFPSLWAWSAPDGTNVFANWPGQELTEGEDGWYTYEIPDWVNSIIINGNLGEVQTADISIEPKDVWVVVTDAETYEVFYEEPALEEAPAETEAQVTPAETESATETVSETESSNLGLIIGIVAVIIVLCVIVVIIINSKKKAK